MRRIKRSKNFKRDIKKLERSGKYSEAMKKRFEPALNALMNDEPLNSSYYDHQLIGSMQGARECHILFDIVLVYWLVGDDVLYLDRLNTHSEALRL